jgi:hypothetical protein
VCGLKDFTRISRRQGGVAGGFYNLTVVATSGCVLLVISTCRSLEIYTRNKK